MYPLFGFIEGLLTPGHLIILLIVGILFFGKRLPEVGRSLGKGIVEFKKGLKGLEDDLDTTTPSRQETAALQAPPTRPPERIAPTAPKFEDNPGNITAPPKG